MRTSDGNNRTGWMWLTVGLLLVVAASLGAIITLTVMIVRDPPMAQMQPQADPRTAMAREDADPDGTVWERPVLLEKDFPEPLRRALEQDAASAPAGLSNDELATRIAEILHERSDGKVGVLSVVEPDELDVVGVFAVNSMTGEPFIAWGHPSGEAIFIGPLIDAQGRDLTLMYEAEALGGKAVIGGRFASEPTMASDRILGYEIGDTMGDATPVEYGSGDRALFVYFDIDCMHCQRFWQAAQDYLEHIRLFVIPVATMADPERVAEHFFPEEERSVALRTLRRNQDSLVKVASRPVTPVIVYQDRNQIWRVRDGNRHLSDAAGWASLISAIHRMPAEVVDDLARGALQRMEQP